MAANLIQERTVPLASTFDRHLRPAPARNGQACPDPGGMVPPPVTSMEEVLVEAATENTIAAVEAERRRISALLKSNVVESLKLLLSQARYYEQTLAETPTTQLAISILASLTRQVMQQVQEIEANLYPTVLEAFGLEPALVTLVNQARSVHERCVARRPKAKINAHGEPR